jgi:RNA polymerase sigma-70 factor (ECF subfamily)
VRLAAANRAAATNNRHAGSKTMSLEPSLQSQMLAAVPALRAFARSLCGSADRVDDLVQETLLRGIAHIGSFVPGTNIAAWLTTIMRNTFINERRKRARCVADPQGTLTATLVTQPAQEECAQAAELRAALLGMPRDQRDAIVLVGGQGLSYEEAAAVCHCAVGTMKSRTSRARTRLAGLMSIEHAEDIGPSGAIRAALCNGALHWAA